VVTDVRNFLFAEDGFDQQLAFGGGYGVAVDRNGYL